MVKWKEIKDTEIENDDESIIWKPENVDEWISGEYFDIDTDIGVKGDSTMYHIRSEDGTHYKVWGTTVLDGKMNKVEVGQTIRIEYKGKHQGKSGNFYKVFRVLVADDGEGGDGGEQPTPSSSSSKPSRKGKPVSGKLRFTANGLLKDARSNLVGYGNMEPSQQDIKKELKAMYDDGDMNTYKPFKKGELLKACQELLREAYEDYEEFLDE